MTVRQKGSVVLGVLLVAAGCAYFAAARAVDQSVRDGRFLRLISGKTATKLGGSECGYLPIARRGLKLRSAGILVRGRPPHHLVELSAINLQARCSLRKLWQSKLTIPRLEASQLQAAFGEAAAAQLEKILPARPNLEPADDTESPIQIDIRETDIAQTDILWGDTVDSIGALKGVNTRFVTKDRGIDIFARGGTFQQTGWPGLAVDALHFNWSKSKLIVKSADLSMGSPKDFSVTGEFVFGEHGSMKLHLTSKKSPAEPLVMGYWKGKFDGILDSETDLEKGFEPGNKVRATGIVSFSRATVHDVDVLKKVATVTAHPRFEKPKIDILRFHYMWTGDRLEISEFEAEVRGLCRLEGKFTIENKGIDGDFKIGAAPDVLDALPGAREEVFTESRKGYLWTSLKLDGPAGHPREDLKPRLIAAAQKHFAKGLLAPILKSGDALIEQLKNIY